MVSIVLVILYKLIAWTSFTLKILVNYIFSKLHSNQMYKSFCESWFYVK